MKLLLENWRKYLNEIGGATLDPYRFKLQSRTDRELIFYGFETPKNDYTVTFKYKAFVDEPKLAWDISFNANEEIGASRETGENVTLQVMATIVAIIKDFINKVPRQPDGIFHFRFEGELKDEEDSIHGGKQASSRTKLYKRFLERGLAEYPGAKVGATAANKIHFSVPREKYETPT